MSTPTVSTDAMCKAHARLCFAGSPTERHPQAFVAIVTVCFSVASKDRNKKRMKYISKQTDPRSPSDVPAALVPPMTTSGEMVPFPLLF